MAYLMKSRDILKKISLNLNISYNFTFLIR